MREVLLPTLRRSDWVIASNLAVHKDEQVEQMIESVGARLVFLPPCSPDLNPIEKMWSKVKACLRQIKARTKEALMQAIALALDGVSAADVCGWFRACGYTVNQ